MLLSAHKTRNSSTFGTLRSRIAQWAIVVVAMIPAVSMAHFCFTHGGSSFSDDYGFYIPFLAKFLNGDANLRDFLIACMHGPHFVAIPLAMRMLVLRLGYWSPELENCVTFVIAVLRVLFLYLIFARCFKSITMRCAVALILCAGIFAPAQLSLFVYGDAGITMGLDNLGFLFGLWSLITFPDRWAGVLLACCGALLSTASWGVGVGWLVLLATMWATRFRSIKHYATFAIVAIMAHIPMLIRTIVSHGSADGVVSLFNPAFIVGALGRPMSPGVDRIDVEYVDGIVAGIAALILACLTVFATIGHRRFRKETSRQTLLPCVAMMVYSLFCLYEVSAFRGGIGSWYTALSVNFWIGLCIAALSLLDNEQAASGHGKIALPRVIGIGSLLISAVLFLRSNASYEDKTPFLKSRSLSADSCIRHYENSPTFCELLVFMWQPTYEFESFSKFFERTETSVFGKRQTWALQGDFPLSNVDSIEPSAASRIRWVEPGDRQLNAVSWNSATRLDMVAGPQATLNWTIDIPSRVTAARLKTETLGQGARISIRENGRTVDLAGGDFKKDQWSVVDVPLSQYAGKSVVIEFSNFASVGDSRAIFRYPRIEIQQARHPSRPSEIYRGAPSSIPTNSGTSKRFPPSTSNDMILDASTSLLWKDMYQHVFSAQPAAACLGDYQALKFSVALPPTISKRLLRIIFHAVRADGTPEERQADIELFEDSDLHGYSYDLRLLNMDYANKIEDLRIASPFGAGDNTEQNVRFTIQDMRLVRKSGNASLCKF